MKKSILAMAALATALTTFATAPAQARNMQVEEALKSRPELSDFYHGLVSTGVINELREDQTYTVFAPVNSAFAEFMPSQYPCFYSADCRPAVAQILRNHIVPGEKHLSDIYPQQGGIMSLFSLNDRHLTASEPRKGTFEVDGRKVLSENQLAGGVLYRVDGVIVRPRDMAQFSNGTIVNVSDRNGLPPRTPQGEIVTHTVTTTEPAYSSGDYSIEQAY